MADVDEVQVFVDDHHKKCVAALKRIAELLDVNSKEYERTFSEWFANNKTPSGRIVVETMRDVAVDALGDF